MKAIRDTYWAQLASASAMLAAVISGQYCYVNGSQWLLWVNEALFAVNLVLFIWNWRLRVAWRRLLNDNARHH